MLRSANDTYCNRTMEPHPYKECILSVCKVYLCIFSLVPQLPAAFPFNIFPTVMPDYHVGVRVANGMPKRPCEEVPPAVFLPDIAPAASVYMCVARFTYLISLASGKNIIFRRLLFIPTHPTYPDFLD